MTRQITARGADQDSLPPIALNERTIATIRRLTSALRPTGDPRRSSISALSAASPSERALLEARVAELDRADLPAPPNVLAKIITGLLSAFPTATGDVDDARLVVQTYLMALDGLPHYAVREAAMRYLSGRVERRDHAYAPKPPELARLARQIATPFRAERYQIGRILAAEIEERPDEAARRAAVERWEKIKAGMLAAGDPDTPKNEEPGEG